MNCTTLWIFIFLCTQSYVCYGQFKSVFFYPTNIDDFGFSYSHEQARSQMVETLVKEGYHVESSFEINTPENSLQNMMENYISRNYTLLVTCGSQFAATATKVAAKYPNVYFVVAPGVNNSLPNLIVLYPRIYMPCYLSGIVCGLMTKTNKIGFVAGNIALHSFVDGINAFYLGAVRTNPNVTMQLGVTNSFLDAAVEKVVTKILIENGVDCLVSHQNDYTPNFIAGQEYVWNMGIASDVRYLTNEYALTSSIYTWAPNYIRYAMMIINHTWVSEYTFGGFYENSVSLSPWSSYTPHYVKEKIQVVLDQFMTGPEDNVVFCGEDAKVLGILPNHTCLTSKQIIAMNKLHPNIGKIISLKHNDIIQYKYVDYSSVVGIIYSILAIIGILLTIGMFVHMTVNQLNPIYSFSSVFFCQLILVGVLLGYISIFFWLGKPTDQLCMSRVWFSSLGYIIIYTSLLAKNYRILQLFKHVKALKNFSLSNERLIVQFMLPFLLSEVLILGLFQGLAPVMAVSDSTSLLLQENEIDIKCGISEDNRKWLIVIFVYNICCILPGIILSYKTKAIKRQAFNEARAIAMSLYNTLLVGIVAIVLDSLLPYSSVIFTSVAVISTWLICSGIMVFVFLPKFRDVVRGKEINRSTAVNPRTGDRTATVPPQNES